jgi:hypothetical protein
LRADPVPHFLSQRGRRLDQADHDPEFDHFLVLAKFHEIYALGCHFADTAANFGDAIEWISR